MSRLCRLKTDSHGADGKWAYEEIIKLRQQVALLREALGEIAENGLSTSSIKAAKAARAATDDARSKRLQEAPFSGGEIA